MAVQLSDLDRDDNWQLPRQPDRVTDAPVGFAEKPPTVAASHPKAKKKGCSCGDACKRLRGDHDLLTKRIENHLKAHQLEEDAKRPAIWTYKCMTPGCGQLIETGPPESRVGQSIRCPLHGLVPLDLVSPRPA